MAPAHHTRTVSDLIPPRPYAGIFFFFFFPHAPLIFYPAPPHSFFFFPPFRAPEGSEDVASLGLHGGSDGGAGAHGLAGGDLGTDKELAVNGGDSGHFYDD